MAGKQGRNPLHQIIGAECPDFTFTDANGKNVSLERLSVGKLSYLTSASWCGPCRKEMRSMLTIYNELKADDLNSSVSRWMTAKQNGEKCWMKKKLPWVMLWDKTGFPKNSKTQVLSRLITASTPSLSL